MHHHIEVRLAESKDVPAMFHLIQPYVEKHIILGRSEDDICQHLQEFIVAEYDDAIVGVAAIHVYGANLAEIRSLAVASQHQGLGIGKLLVEGCEKVSTRLGMAKLFALTYVTSFFEKLDYKVVQKESLPQKVWTVCVHCSKFNDCDEVAVQKVLSTAPIEPMRMLPILQVDQDQ
ncbi:MAG: N-acetyltransferase [Mariprofundaceae bacterium]